MLATCLRRDGDEEAREQQEGRRGFTQPHVGRRRRKPRCANRCYDAPTSSDAAGHNAFMSYSVATSGSVLRILGNS